MKYLALVLAVSLCCCFLLPAADFDGDGTPEIAVFRDGLWLARGLTRFYLGASGDLPVPGDYNGDLKDEAAVFRPGTGLWNIRGLTRAYFGSSGDIPRSGDYNGDGTEEVAVFRPNQGLWIARNLTRFYFGASGDESISPGKLSPLEGEISVSGQTVSYQSGDDGYYQAGAEFCFQTSIKEGFLLVRDRNTGLTWAGDGNGPGCNFGQQTDWNSAVDRCRNLIAGGYSDWRLPNAKELESIVHYGEIYPAVDEIFFPNTKNERYWSSTTYSSASRAFAFGIDFRGGYFYSGTKATDLCCLRAVRGPDSPGGGGTREADFGGDGIGRPAVFRPSSGLWAARGLTRLYFGTTGDSPVPGNYDGEDHDRAAVFRPASGLWAVRGLTRLYWGDSSDVPVPGDYRGNREDYFAVFRPSSGLWLSRGFTRAYYGAYGDQPLAPGRTGGPKQCPVPVTGQTTSYREGDDGYHEAGAPFDFDTFTLWGATLVADNNTGLIWAADGDQAGCCFGTQTDWAAAVRWCENLSFGGITVWRLANARELQTIVDYSRTYPPVDPAYFPHTKDNFYWTSTTTKNNTAWAFIMQFDVGGYLDDDAKTALYHVRAVAGP